MEATEVSSRVMNNESGQPIYDFSSVEVKAVETLPNKLNGSIIKYHNLGMFYQGFNRIKITRPLPV